MQNIDTRLNKFILERDEIHKKMQPIKDMLKPLSKRLKQVSKNIETLKVIKKKS
jgi:archaellum component FlaC